MSVVLLVHGHPGNGKSTLSRELRDNHSFEMLSLDEEYVDFIRRHCPIVFFEALRQYVGPHYDSILSHRGYSQTHFGRDFVGEWHTHLRNRIEELAGCHSRLVVEGYLLRDFKDDFHAKPPRNVLVFQIESKQFIYRHHGKTISVDQIAALGN